MYPTLSHQPQTHEPDQLQQILQRLSSASMQVPAYRSGSSYSLWQLKELVKDPETHSHVMQAQLLPTLVALLLDSSLPECQVNAAGILRRLTVRNVSSCEAILKAGAVSALVQLLSASNTEARAAAAGCLCLLGWNSSHVKSEIIFTMCKAAKDQTGQISTIHAMLPLFSSSTPSEVEAAAACLHMLSEAASADVLATFELRDSGIAQHLCKTIESGSPVATFAAAETLKNLIQLPANRVEVMQQLLALMESGSPAGQADAANLCWELCCVSATAHNLHMTTLISSQPRMLPSLSCLLSSTDPEVVRAALGLVHVLALEVSKAQNSFANPVNVDLVRIQLVKYTPILDAILSMLLAPGKPNFCQHCLKLAHFKFCVHQSHLPATPRGHSLTFTNAVSGAVKTETAQRIWCLCLSKGCVGSCLCAVLLDGDVRCYLAQIFLLELQIHQERLQQQMQPPI